MTVAKHLRAPFSLLALAILATACASPAPPAYDGPRRDPSEVAVVRTDASVKILKVNGKRIKGDAFEVPAGKTNIRFKARLRGEELGIQYHGQGAACMNTAKFSAEPGGTYRIVKYKVKKGAISNTSYKGMRSFGMDFQTQVIDLETDEVISGATAECEWRQ